MKPVAIFLIALLSASAAAQQAYQPPRAPDGHPDLQGIWTTRWTTPLERPPNFTTLVISPEDGTKLHAATLQRLSATDPLGVEYSWDLSGALAIRGEVRSSLIVDPPDGHLPLTDSAMKLRSNFRPFTGADGPEQRGLNERCLMAGSGYAPFLTIPASNMRQIVQTRDYLLFYTESFGQLRIIPLDGAAGPAIPRGGSSSARWEGDTLVVETTRFLATDRFRFSPGSAFPITPATRITERFTRAGESEILYRYTVEDPALYTRAWTAESLLKRSTERIYEWACHEANYGLANILRGQRVVDQRAAAAAGKPHR
jgi:hypothetical protein